MKKPGMQIVLVKPEQRTDSDRRKDLDHWFGRRLEEIFKKVSGVTIENLGVKARNKRKKAMLFGSHDGIHLAGETGAYWATHRATLLLQRVTRRSTTQPPWWSAFSETRSQEDIDKVKNTTFAFCDLITSG